MQRSALVHGHALHLKEGRWPIRDKVQDQSRDSDVNGSVRHRDFHRAAALNDHLAGELLSCSFKKAFGGIHPSHRKWRTMIKDRAAKRSRTAAHVEPASMLGNAKPR